MRSKCSEAPEWTSKTTTTRVEPPKKSNPIVLPSLVFTLGNNWNFQLIVNEEDGSLDLSQGDEFLASTDSEELEHLIEALQTFNAIVKARQAASEESETP